MKFRWLRTTFTQNAIHIVLVKIAYLSGICSKILFGRIIKYFFKNQVLAVNLVILCWRMRLCPALSLRKPHSKLLSLEQLSSIFYITMLLQGFSNVSFCACFVNCKLYATHLESHSQEKHRLHCLIPSIRREGSLQCEHVNVLNMLLVCACFSCLFLVISSETFFRCYIYVTLTYIYSYIQASCTWLRWRWLESIIKELLSNNVVRTNHWNSYCIQLLPIFTVWVPSLPTLYSLRNACMFECIFSMSSVLLLS